MNATASIAGITADIARESARIMAVEPDESARLRTGALPELMDSPERWFAVWDISGGMLRDYSMYSLYSLVRIVHDESVPVAAVARMARELDAGQTGLLRQCGFGRLLDWSAELARLGAAVSREEYAAALSALNGYANRLASWTYHYLPWHLGGDWRLPSRAAAGHVQAPGPRAVLTRTDDVIRLRWEPSGVSVRAWLASRDNPELCADFLRALPFTVLQDHAVVAGQSIFAWAPLVSTAPIRCRETILSAPIGRMRFSQGTGQKVIVQYGRTTETAASPVLGEVVAEDVERLAAVGEAVRRSTYETKEPIWLSVERAA